MSAARRVPCRETRNALKNYGGPGETRTPGTRFRKPLLCPSELQALTVFSDSTPAMRQGSRGSLLYFVSNGIPAAAPRCCGYEEGRREQSGSTNSHASPPSAQNAAATRNDAVQPRRCAITGVSAAVMALPVCAPMFIKPESEPEDLPPRSADSAQYELCER